MAQDAELKLKVSLDLAFFRQQLSTIGTQLGGQSVPIAIRFDKKAIADQYRLLDRYIRGKKFTVELNLVGGLTKNEFDKIKGRLDDLRELRKVEIPIGIKNGATGKDVDKVVTSIKERLAQNQQIKQGGGKLRIETSVKPSITNEDIAVFKKAVKNKLSKIGALEIPTKLDVPKAEDLLKALQKHINRQKPLLAKTSIKPSILSADVKAFKKAVESKLSGITVKINAELETIGGGKTKAQIEKEVLAGLERIQQMGAERMGGGVTEPARRESLRQSLQGRDIGELKDIGKQLGVAGVGKFRNTQNLIERIVTEASIEMITKYLDPQAVMRNPDRSGLNKVLDTFARAFFRSFMSEEQIKKEVSQMREAQAPKIQPSLPRVAGLLPSVTQKTSITQGTEAIVQQLIRQQAGDEAGVLVDTKRIYAALQKNIEDFLRRTFTVIEVDVTQTTMGIKDAMGAFAYLAQALQDAESRAVKAKIGDAVSSLITKVVGALRSAEAQAIIPVKVVDYTGQRSVLPPTSPITGSPRLALPSAGETTQPGQTRFNAVSGGYNRPAPLEARPFYMAPAFASTTRRIPGSAGRMARGTAKPKMVGQEIPLGPSGGGPEEAAFVKAAQNALKFGLATDIAKKSVDNFRASQLPLIGGLREIGSEFGFAIKQVLLFGTAYKALAFVQSLPGQILNAAKSQQQYNNALQTATQDTGTFAKELLYVDNVQRAFGLNLETTRTGFTRLYASMAPTGFDSGSIEKLFTGISAATAALQLTPDKAERVIYAFGQMASKGQIMSEELKGQLGDVLPGALAIFAKAAGMSVKEFSKAMEDGEFVGSKFRDTFAKVADELMKRFGTGAQAAGKSLQGLLNTVQGDFQRTLESFAPLANAAAQAILGPLGGSLKQLSMSAQIATGEVERTFAQLKQAQQDVADLKIGGADASEIKAAEQNVAALAARYQVLQQAAKDPAIAKQAQDIQLFTQELAKAGTFVMNVANVIGNIFGPILRALGTNMTSVISTVIGLYTAFQTMRLVAMGTMGALLAYRAISTILGFSQATVGAKALAGAFNALGVAATGAQIKTIGLTRALQVFTTSTIIGAVVAGIVLVASAFATMRDRANEAQQAAKDSLQATKDAATQGSTAMVQMQIGVTKVRQQDVETAVQLLETLRKTADASKTIRLTAGQQRVLELGGIQVPRGGEYAPGATTALVQQANAQRKILKDTLRQQEQDLIRAKSNEKRIGLNVPTPPSTKPETEAPDEKALKKAQQDAEQAAKQEQQRRIELAGLQNDMDKIGFDYRMGLSDTQFEHEKQLIDELNNYELSGLNDRHARQLKFAQDLKKVQLNAIDAIRKARQKVDEAQLNVVTARRSAQAAGDGGGINSGPIIGGFTPVQLSSATAAASKFTGIANMCSESVKAFYKSLGISLPGVTAWADTVRNAGTTMKDWSKLAPGDIVATGKPGDTPHVGVYTGGQNVFHQSRSRGLRAGNYPDLDYFKQGGYFVRPSAGIKQSSTSFSMDTKAQKESFDLIKEQAKASAQTALQQLEIQNALKIAYVQTASTIKANIDNIFPVEKQKLDLSLQQMRHNLLMQGMPQEYIDYEEKRAAATEEAAMAVNVMKDSLSGAKAELKVYNDAVAGGTKLSVDQQANVTRLTGSIAALEEGLANAAKQQREYNIASLESAIATMKQADALKAMEEVSGRINDAVTGVTDTYKSLFKEIAMGEDSVEVLKKAQKALADQFLTMVFDMAMKPVEESMKNTLGKMFGVPNEKEQREKTIASMEAQLAELQAHKVHLQNIETNTGIAAGKSPVSSGVSATPAVPGQMTAAGTSGGFLTGTAALQTLPFNGQTGGMLQNLPFPAGDTGFLSAIGINGEELSASISESANAYSEQLSKVDTSVFESANALGTAGTELGKEGAAGKKWHESLGQAVGGLGMAAGAVMGIVAGINQIKEGGTSNVLGGIGMIASMAGSLLGNFGGLFGGGGGASSIVQGTDIPIAQMPAGMQFANGGVAFGGFRAFANGGTVSGPTLGLVGEGKYNEAIVPLPDGRSIPVQLGGRSARDLMGNGAPGMPQAPSLSMKFETTKINGVEYVSREQLEQAMAETRRASIAGGAQRGMSMTLDKIKQSPSTRSSIGIR